MRPQEMGQREASGRRQREVHPQQPHGGSELGAAAEALRKAPCPPLAAMSTLRHGVVVVSCGFDFNFIWSLAIWIFCFVKCLFKSFA